MMEAVKQRMDGFGCAVQDSDMMALRFVIQKVESDICSACNIKALPCALQPVAIDRVVGELLFEQKSSGRLEGIDVDAAVKQLREGDTTITFAIGEGDATPEQRLDRLIQHLMTSGQNIIARHRRLSW